MTLTLRHLTTALAVLLAAGLLAACGGGSDNADTAGGGATATTQAETTATTETGTTTAGGGTQADAEGKQVFSENCASCHTLSADDASGQVGPNLDDLQPSKATVVRQVTNGGGGMPAFGDQLSDAQIQAVATYVADNAGS